MNLALRRCEQRHDDQTTCAQENTIYVRPLDNRRDRNHRKRRPVHGGTLSLPANGDSQQAVLFIASSGPIDRNQNSAQVQLNIFNAVAACLATEGIASLRYDKRGCGNSAGDYGSTGHPGLVADAAAWLRYLQQDSLVKGLPTFVLGHGEGTVISPQLIAGNDTVAGQVLLAPYLDNYETVIRRQAEKALAEIAETQGFKGKFIRVF